MQLFFGIRLGKDLGNDAEDNNRKCMGKGNYKPKQDSINCPAAGANHVCGDNSLAVPGLKGMQGTQGYRPQI